MAIEGALQDVGLADICQLLAMGRKTGCLSITDRSNFGYVYFENGRVIYASLLNRPDRLGELLVRNGVVDEDALERAMALQTENRHDRPLGQILLDQGALSSEDLHKYIRVQIEEAVYHLFTWTQGSFHFDVDQRPEEDELYLVDIPAESLLLEGARRVDEWSLVEKKVPSFDLVFEVVRDPAEDPDVELEPDQVRILPLIDGVRTAAEIVSASGKVEFEVGKALYGLIQAGFVEQTGMRASDGPETDEKVRQHLKLGTAFYRSGMLEDAEREFDAVLEADPGHPRALHYQGLVAFRGRRYEDALEIFDRIRDDGSITYGVQRNRALALEMLGRYGEALEALNRCDQARPGDPGVALSRGAVLMQAGAPAEAMKELSLYRADPDVRRPEPLFYAAAVLASAMAGRVDDAAALGREGLALHPESGPVLVNTAAVMEHRGEFETAEALYSRASRLTPPPAQAHKALGDRAYVRGDLDEARGHYEKAVKIDPRLGDDVYLRLGTLAHAEGDHDVARLAWRRALELNPDNQAVRGHLESLDRGD